jgi:hypothetical protein
MLGIIQQWAVCGVADTGRDNPVFVLISVL